MSFIHVCRPYSFSRWKQLYSNGTEIPFSYVLFEIQVLWFLQQSAEYFLTLSFIRLLYTVENALVLDAEEIDEFYCNQDIIYRSHTSNQKEVK